MKWWLWLVPTLMTAHNLEKALAAVRPDQLEPAPAPLGQLLLATGVVAALAFALTALLIKSPKGGLGIRVLLGLQGLMLIDAVVSIGVAVRALGYVPGLWTSVVSVPCSVLIFRRAFLDGYVTRRSFLITVGISLIAYLSLAWGLPRLGDVVGRCTGCG